MGRLCIGSRIECSIREHCRAFDGEVMGLLVGRAIHGIILVEGAWRGPDGPASRTRVRMDGATLALAAQKVLSDGKGAIVGWYHSHPGHGVFMSPTDVSTQQRLVQFSPHIVAAVYDPTTDEMGYFSGDLGGPPRRLEDGEIHRFEGARAAIPDGFYLERPLRFCPTCRCLVRRSGDDYACAHCGRRTGQPLGPMCPECGGKLVFSRKHFTGYCKPCKAPMSPRRGWWPPRARRARRARRRRGRPRPARTRPARPDG